MSYILITCFIASCSTILHSFREPRGHCSLETYDAILSLYYLLVFMRTSTELFSITLLSTTIHVQEHNNIIEQVSKCLVMSKRLLILSRHVDQLFFFCRDGIAIVLVLNTFKSMTMTRQCLWYYWWFSIIYVNT